MPTIKSIVAGLFLVVAGFGLTALSTQAATFFNSPTVTSANRTATFDSLTSNDINLLGYTEGMLSVSVNDLSFQGFGAFVDGDARTTGFHYGAGGNNSFVTIAATDDALILALDFLLGEGNPGPKSDISLKWETLLNGFVTSSGIENDLTQGSVVGWTDATGFDELRVAATSVHGSPGFGNSQRIAIDDLRVAAVPIPAALPLLVTALAGLGLIARRKKQAV